MISNKRSFSRRSVLWWTGSAAVAAGAAAVGLGGAGEAAAGEAGAGEAGAGNLSGGAGPVPATIRAARRNPATRRPVRTVHDIRPSAPRDAVALTIDDGPDPHWTPQVLDLLRSNGLLATFSLVGEHAHAHPDLVRRIVGDGHGICNHTMNHPQPFSRRSAAVIRRQISDAQSVIVDAAGSTPTLFRSPGGDWAPSVLGAAADLGLIPLAWDIDPRDWSRPGIAQVTRRLLAARPGDILLCHDGGGDRAQTVAALRSVLPTLRGRGLSFVPL